jgi:hypothetical protein
LQANQTANAGYALTQGVRLTEGAQTRAVEALTPTNTPTVTPTNTLFPTWTPEPTSTPLPTVIPPQNVLSAYKLADPNPRTLIELIGQSLAQRNLTYDYPLEYQNLEALAHVVDFEWERRYLGMDFESSLLVSLQEIDEYSWYSWYRPEFRFDYLAGATTDYFNQNAIELANGKLVSTPNFNAKIYLVEIDHDSEPEWLVWSEFDKFKAGVWVTLDQVTPGQYVRLTNEIQVRGGVGSPDYSLYRLQDFTGDGLSDAIILWDAYFGGGTEVKQFQFLKGTPDGFKRIFEMLEDNNSVYEEISYEWVEIETAIPFLRVIHEHYLEWCSWSDVNEFIWRGEKVEEKQSPSQWPDSADCAIAAATRNNTYDQTSKQYFEMALNLDADSPQLTPKNLVFVHYRLALLNALEGNDLKTREHIKSITDLAGKGEPLIAVNLANQILPLLSGDNIYPYQLCQAAEELFTSIFLVSVSDYAHAYEGLPDGYPSPLCETNSIRRQVLDERTFNEFGPQKDSLEAEGLSVAEIRPVFIAQSLPAWLVFFATHTDGFDNQGNTIWQDQEAAYLYLQETGWKYIGSFSPENKPEWINTDLGKDGQIELAYGEQYEDSRCESDQLGYTVYLISDIGNGWFVPADDFICLPLTGEFDLVNYLQDQNKDRLVDWLEKGFYSNYDFGLLENYTPIKPIVFEWDEIKPLTYKPDLLTSLDTQFFTSPTPFLLRPDLEFYRTRWGTGDDPASAQIYAHLTYLLALTYELEGKETQAVELFYALWLNHPDTLWAYLAAARLTLK